MIHHSTHNITIEIDKLIDTVVVVGDKVDENAIANQVIAALNKAVENAHKTDPRLLVARWGIPQPKIKRDDLKDWAKAFDAAKDREERIAAMRIDFDL